MKLFKSLIKDFLNLFVKERTEKNKIIFLVHPRDNSDIFKKIPILKKAPKFILNIFEKFMWPVTASDIRYEGKKIGYMISTPCTAKTMLKNRALAKKKIRQALKLGINKGGSIVALGAMTASLSRGGLDLKDMDINITTGHAYTVLNISSIFERIISDFGANASDVRLAVVGAAGSIGSNSAKRLSSPGVQDILLIDLQHKKDKIDELSRYLLENSSSDIKISVSHDLNRELLKDRNVIIAATSHPDALIRSEYISPGTVIIDDAQPSDVDPEAFKRDDILILEGGAAKIKGVQVAFPLGLCNKDDNFSCMAEAVLLKFTGNEAKAMIGALSETHLRFVEDLLRENKVVQAADYQNYVESCIDDKKIADIKNIWVKKFN